MIKEKDIKPIPNYIAKIMKRKSADGFSHFYSYLTKVRGELVRITVACKTYDKQWFCKQVVVHGIHSNNCLVRDMEYSLMGFSVGWYDEGISKSRKTFDDNKWCKAPDKYYEPYAPIVNRKYALKFDEYKYSVADKYMYNDFFKYLRIYEQYPQAEYLMKMGLQHLATKKLILIKVEKDKDFRKWLIRNTKILKNEYGNYPYFTAQTIFSAYKRNISILEAQKFDLLQKELLQDYNYSNYIGHVITKDEIYNFLKYIEKQNANISSYADYVKACEYLNLDMSLDKNKYPHDFKKWHDIRIDEYHSKQAEEDKEKRKAFYKDFEIIAKKYLSLERLKQEDFVVIIAKSPAELIREGKILHHCVGYMGYDQKFVREESLIFFIRDKNNVKKPFVTVEYSPDKHKVLQCYGNNDSKPSDNVLEFVNKKWLPYANRKLKQLVA